MKYLLKNKNFWKILMLDLLLLFISYYFSYLIRFEGDIPPIHATAFKRTVWFIVPLKLISFLLFGLYRGMWRYTSIPDLLNIVKATLFSSSTIMLGILFIHQFQGFARSVFVIDAVLTLLLIGGVRLFIRIFLTRMNGNGRSAFGFFPNGGSNYRRLLLVGAGDAGEKMLREIRDNPRLEYHVVGFVDDDRQKRGMRIHGVPILGGVEDLGALVKDFGIDEILIAISSANGREMRRIVDRCEATGVKFKTLPGIGELIGGTVSIKAIRDVAYEDLMRREPVQLELKKIGGYIANKSVLVTGAGGSIGSELCRHIAKFSPSALILLDCTESNLYQIEMEFVRSNLNLKYVPVLGNILNKELLRKIFGKFEPQVVFHAAAYKHVPMMELNPWEAVSNNIQGTWNVLEASQNFHVERFVLVSTDKAVRPANVMGASKRVAELLTQSYAKTNGTRFMAVRFGNVIGSSGSVVPLFRKQIEKGGPVTVTHPEVTRFFMTIPEAAQLILQAGSMGDGSEIFILDMGTPVKILDLARDLIRLSGFEPGRDIEIKFTGLRPGEKLYEELITDGEGIVPTEHKKILVLRSDQNDFAGLQIKIEKLIEVAFSQNAAEIKMKLKGIVPEYQIFVENEWRAERRQMAANRFDGSRQEIIPGKIGTQSLTE